ncbi:hypothetical protein EDD27_2535 [Nonomuraea polychroma]|uniref:Uncharacterized protein n=1 Tax=Nonomuraea polychroma TaxID=46176 RepID=A0A438M3A9_9ACTN|nr:hypothetical protein [Nonomuraea polychroma]RVX40141.1 hypothetical protein EDD27_2535 [Nonomuraea polychroma]
MNMHNDDERLDETADLPPLPPESVLRRGNEGKSRLPPPSDKLVFGLAVQPDAPPVLSEPLLNSDPAD